MLIPLFIKKSRERAAGALCWLGGENRSAARVSMHIHASPIHWLTATTLQAEMGEMVEKKARGGEHMEGRERGNWKGDQPLNTLSISRRSIVWSRRAAYRHATSQQL